MIVDQALRFVHGNNYPVEIEMHWDGEDLVVWVKMDCGVDADAEFGIGGFDIKGAHVQARANFAISEDQAREWRDALTKMIEMES